MISVELIHPMIVHFPIVFIVTLAVFDVIATVRGANVTGRTTIGNISTALAVLAALSAVLATMFGDLALGHAEAGGFSSNIAEIHEGLGSTVATVLGIWALIRVFFWWRDTRFGGPAAYLVATVAVVGAALTMATAYYGGELVYDLGVNVAGAAHAAAVTD